jgi:hypothetical protein
LGLDNKALDTKKIDYEALEQARSLALQVQLKAKLKNRQVGKDSSLRQLVLGAIVDSKYDNAADVIEEFLALKDAYPGLRLRATPHANHAKELINAIRLKRNFPNLSSLSMSKQQEILDHAVNHFDELKLTLKMIEQMTREEAVRDIRSTVWVVRTLAYTISAIVVMSFLIEFNSDLRFLIWGVFNDLTDVMFSKLSHLW